MNEPNIGEQDGQQAPILGLLQTAGGSVEPLVHTICTLHPQVVVFVGSEATLTTIVEVKKAVQKDCTGHAPPEFKTVLVENEADLVACHQAACEGLALLRQRYSLARESIRIDFTGGTKAMSAAVVLAAAPDGYQFAYVSGHQRDRQGVGAVVTGSEKLCLTDNPWIVLEEPELRRLLDMAVLGQWAAALDSTQRLVSRATDASRPIFQHLRCVLDGLRQWDRFEHQPAWRAWGKGAAPGKLAESAVVGGRRLLVDFAQKCLPMIGRLSVLANSADSRTAIKQGDPLVLDMLGNGERHARRGQFDEAALRYYRALELTADRRLRILFTIDNGAVREQDVPQALRNEFLSRKGTPSPLWKLGQYESVQLLASKDDPVGRRLLADMQANRLDCQARNENWLIHGTRHVEEAQFLAFRRNVLPALGIAEGDVFAWPDFRAGATTG
jgi:CRISPR-associated protein (TIGR02710 family)